MRRIAPLLLLLVALAMVAAACSDDDSSDPFVNGAFDTATSGAAVDPAAGFDGTDDAGFAEEAAADFAEADGDFDAAGERGGEPSIAVPPATGVGATTTQALQDAARRIIYSAFLTVRVEVVDSAATEVQAIAESVGGFVESLDLFGEDAGQRARLTLRVPQAEFFTALDRVEAVGDVLEQSVTSQDVTEQFVDLEARLRSAELEESRLLALLDQANDVTDVLTIERELARVRTEVERLQGQLNFLSRRTDFSTISVELIGPDVRSGEPPSASMRVVVGDVTGTVDAVRALVASVDGELDQVSILTSEDEESAILRLRVKPGDFGEIRASLADLGDLVSQEINEGRPGDAPPEDEEATAPISLRLAQGEDDDDAAWIIGGIVGGGVVLLGLMGLTVWLRRQRGSGPPAASRR